MKLSKKLRTMRMGGRAGRAARSLKRRPGNPLAGDLGALVETELDVSYPQPEERPSGESWGGNPFGPFTDPRETSETKRLAKERQALDDVVDHDFVANVDLRGMGDFTPIYRKDVSAFQTGLVVVEVAAIQSAAQVGVENTNYAEIRLIAFVAGTPYIAIEQACGAHGDLDEDLTSGALRYEFELGDVPDRIEIHARARQGGSAETAQNADETLSASITTRFHR